MPIIKEGRTFMDPRDRRRSKRVISRFALRYRLIPFDGSGYHDALAEDLSLDGVRFRGQDVLRARTGMLFELLMPGEEPLHIFGRAIWVLELPNQEGFEVRVRFEDQSTATRWAIGRHIERETAASSR